jgi:hypothetical protein
MAGVQFNHQFKNEPIAGNNEKFFDEWKEIIQLNDGKRKCDSVYKNCTDDQAPFQFSSKTNIHITSKDFDISNIRKG